MEAVQQAVYREIKHACVLLITYPARRIWGPRLAGTQLGQRKAQHDNQGHAAHTAAEDATRKSLT